MKKTLLLITCAVCLFLCACTPNNSKNPDTTPAPTEPKPTPGSTAIAPTGTPGEYIDVVDPSGGSVVIPVETPGPTPEEIGGSTPDPTPSVTPAPTPDGTPAPTPAGTPTPTPGVTTQATSNGIDLPYIPVRPL